MEMTENKSASFPHYFNQLTFMIQGGYVTDACAQFEIDPMPANGEGE
jgi:hypothetical protein